MGGKRWTIQEEKIIIDLIKSNPDNLDYAFQLASFKIGKLPTAIKVRWYTKLKYDGPVFRLTSEKFDECNRKNTVKKTVTWQLPIKDIAAILSIKDRKELLTLYKQGVKVKLDLVD